MQFKSERVLPPSSKQHMVVAWLAGALMSWLAESYRRCTFANQQAARLAHAKELEEKSRHLSAQEELASAREEVRHRHCPPAFLVLLGTLLHRNHAEVGQLFKEYYGEEPHQCLGGIRGM